MPTAPDPSDAIPPRRQQVHTEPIQFPQRHWQELDRIAKHLGVRGRDEALRRLLERFPV